MKLKEGDDIWFYHYGSIKYGTVARISPCGKIVYLEGGNWLHYDSCHLVS